MKIVTVTLNPSVDKFLRVAKLTPGLSHDGELVAVFAGGKGINVSRSLKSLGILSIPTGFAGGSVGQDLLRDLIVERFEPQFVFTEGNSRVNLTLLETMSRKVTRVLEPGPMISDLECENFLTRFSRLSDGARWVVLSGRSSPGLPKDFYETLIREAQNQKAKVAFDAAGLDLASGIVAQPFLLKINRQEAESYLRKRLRTQAALKSALRRFLRRGIKVAVITLGDQGAVGGDGVSFFHVRPPKLTPISLVGSGDAFMAGFITAWQKRLEAKGKDLRLGGTLKDALVYGAAAGSASTLSLKPGELKPEAFAEILQKISVVEI